MSPVPLCLEKWGGHDPPSSCGSAAPDRQGLVVTGVCCCQAYFWTYDAKTGECVLRVETTLAGGEGGSLLWSVWSWVSELTVFLVVPLIILTFNVLVIRELRALDRHSPSSAAGWDHPGRASDAAQLQSGKHQVRFVFQLATSSSAVAKRPRDASCLSVVS